jgi:hypothetical protein
MTKEEAITEQKMARIDPDFDSLSDDSLNKEIERLFCENNYLRSEIDVLRDALVIAATEKPGRMTGDIIAEWINRGRELTCKRNKVMQRVTWQEEEK